MDQITRIAAKAARLRELGRHPEADRLDALVAQWPGVRWGEEIVRKG